MNRIVIPTIESTSVLIAELYARAKKIASVRVPNLFAALDHLGSVSLTMMLNSEGALISGNVSDISVAMALAFFTSIFNRIKGSDVDFPGRE